jgi:SnoaL-like domain
MPDSAHIGIGKPGLAEAMSAIGNRERISPSTGCPMAERASRIAIASGMPSLKSTQRLGGKIEMEDHDIRAALDHHWAASDANEFAAEHDIYREDAVLEYPQSGERIRGRRNIQASRVAQPSRKRFTVRRILGAADLWITELVIAYDARPSYTVSIMEFRDGKVARETQYFGDPFAPGPSRAQWVEQIR